MKTCSKCKITKELSEFSNNKNEKDGIQRECKQCQKEYRLKNIDEIKRKKKIYRDNNKEKKALTDKLYRENNKSSIMEYRKKYYKENEDELKLKSINKTDQGVAMLSPTTHRTLPKATHERNEVK
mgnify:CR=1 FL=1